MHIEFVKPKTIFNFALALPLVLSAPLVEAVAPTVSSFNPADNSQNVASSTSQLQVTFDQAVQGSTGNFTLYFENGTQVEQIAGNDAQVTGSGTATLTIALSSQLGNANTNYYVQIDATAVRNGSSEFFAGIADTTTWNFKTVLLRGGSSHRARIERIRNMEPTYNDIEPPSLSDVGIFVPTYAPKTLPPEPVEEKAHEAAPVAEVPVEPTVTQEEPVRQVYVSSFHERVCQRVENRFKNNRKMINRVNQRLWNSFNFECEF